MKKGLKSCLIIAIISIVLCTVGVAVIVFKDVCPPQGPWPMPPWCDGSEEPFVVNPLEIAGVIPAPLSFAVGVPANTPEYTTVYVEFYTETGENIHNAQMEKSSEHEWTLKDTDLSILLQKYGTLKYRYTRNNWGFTGAEEFEPDSPDIYRTISAIDNLERIDTIRKWRWIPEPGYVPQIVNAHIIPFEPRIDGLAFQEGVVFADWWWDTFTPLIDSTNARMKAKSINWVEISPPWDYTQINPTPIISNQVGHAYPDDKLRFHLDKLRQDGLSVYLQPQVCCTSIADATYTAEWWEAWYDQYKEFLLYHAEIANEYSIPYLVVGSDWFVIEMKPEGYEQRLSEIYASVDERYTGKLGRMIYLGGNLEEGINPFYPPAEDMPYMDKWDFMAINFWAGISSSSSPTPEELDANVENIFETRLQPLYEQYGKPLVINSIAYPSVDGGLMGKVDVFDPAIALWEPYSTKYELDLSEQAMGYDAIMKAVAKHNYIIGTYAFAYLPDTYPMTLEYNIRDKPAEEVLSQWYESIP